MKKTIFLLWSAMFLYSQSWSQGHYTVDEQTFDITNTEMIDALIGSTAMPFQATDMHGKDISTAPYSNQTVVVFWNTTCPSCSKMLKGLKAFNANKPANITLITLADETRSELEPFIANNNINFSVIPQSKMLGEAAFADRLGYPRIFIIGEGGTVQKIFSSEMLELNEVPLAQFLLGELAN